MIKVVTHNGSFHADDVFAVATLQLHLGADSIEVIRTRDESVIAEADWVVDVGGVYDPATKRFDHHQNGAPVRENGIPYAAFGLVWKEIGAQVAGSQVSERLEEMLVLPIDAGDTGVSLYDLNDLEVAPFELYQVVGSFSPAWGSSESKDEAFLEAVAWARSFLKRLIEKQSVQLEMEALVTEVYESSEDKTVLMFDMPISALACIKYPEVQIVISPDDPANNDNWTATTVRKEFNSFEGRVSFPEAWGGLRNDTLAEISDIKDAVFCHKARFLFVAESKEGVIKAAQQAS